MGNSQGMLFGSIICLSMLIFFAIILVFLKQQDKNRHEHCPPEVVLPSPQLVQPLPPQQNPRLHTPPTCPPGWKLEARDLYFQGYDDARLGRRPNPIYRDNFYYQRGYREGIPFCPPTFRLNFNFD